jgi:hypothetical protein
MEEDDPLEVSASKFQQAQGRPAKPTVACLRRWNQKLKCNRQLPSCERCYKQHAACMYPSPPYRKRIEHRTNRAKVSQPIIEKQVHQPESLSSAKPTKRQRIAHETSCEAHTSHNLMVRGPAELPSTEIGLLLLEVYFKRVYNSTLLLHRAIAFQLYVLNGILDYLLRAIFAHTAIFLREVDPSHQKYVKIFPMQTLAEKSWSWARSASVEALSHADEPSLIRTQALQVLQLYYFSQNEIQRAIVHTSLAYRLSQVLGYNELYKEVISPNNRSMQFDHEIRR